MAGLAASEIRAFANGTVYLAPSGTAGPANMAAPWTGFTNIGYVDEDAVKLNRSLSTEQVKAWQSIAPLRYLITEVLFMVAFNLIQFDKDTLPFYLGGGSIVNQGGGSFKYVISSTPTIDERVLGIEAVDGSIIYRAVIGRGMVSESGETTLGRTNAAKLPITFAAMTPAAGSELAYLLSNDSAMA